MKKIFLLLMLSPLFAISQNQTVVNYSRYFPKVDKVQEFEKALTAHIQKYHSGDWKWRVYEIQTGPDAGSYQVIEGPKTWDEFDKRGNLGAAHMNDWNKNVAIYLTDKYSSGYVEYRADLSTAQITAYTDKIAITHVFPKIGMSNEIESQIEKFKKVWDVGGQTVAVYQSAASGPSEYSLVSRLKDGLKELEPGYRKPMRERYDAVNGQGTYDLFLKNAGNSAQDVWSEILVYRPDLSAK